MGNELDNSAGQLLRFFGKDPAIDGEEFTLASTVTALIQVENEIALLKQFGYSRFDRYSTEIPRIWRDLYISFVPNISTDAGNFSFSKARTAVISSGAEFLLRDVRDNWIDSTLGTEKCGPELDDLLTAAEELIKSDDSIPKELRTYVYLLINETRAAIELDKQGKKFVLDSAINRLLAALYSAQSQSDKPDSWKDFMQNKVKPFTSNFLGLVLPNLLAGAQLYLQLTQM